MRFCHSLIFALVPMVLSAQPLVLQPPEGRRQEEFRTVPLSANGSLRVDCQVGRVRVTVWDKAEVELRADFVPASNGDQVKLTVEPSADRLVLRTEQPRSRGWFRFKSASCDLELRVPRNCQATIRTDVGRIELEGVRGPVDLRSDVGRIEARDLDGQGKGIRIRTDVGRITLDLKGVKGALRASSDVGRVSLNTPGAKVHLERRREVEATLGGSTGQVIDVRTDVGSIRID